MGRNDLGGNKVTEMEKSFAQIKAIERQNKERLLKVNPLLTNDSGIYVFTRVDEFGIKHCYVGQAISVLTRLAQHLSGYTQHIDRSLKKHKLYNIFNNPCGWNVIQFVFKANELDEREREYIKKYASMGYQLLNKVHGGQDKGRIGLEIRDTPKGYHEGLHNGYKKALKEIALLFDKYLDVSIKGEPNKVKERKLGEFKEMIGENINESEKVAERGENE